MGRDFPLTHPQSLAVSPDTAYHHASKIEWKTRSDIFGEFYCRARKSDKNQIYTYKMLNEGNNAFILCSRLYSSVFSIAKKKYVMFWGFRWLLNETSFKWNKFSVDIFSVTFHCGMINCYSDSLNETMSSLQTDGGGGGRISCTWTFSSCQSVCLPEAFLSGPLVTRQSYSKTVTINPLFLSVWLWLFSLGIYNNIISVHCLFNILWTTWQNYTTII